MCNYKLNEITQWNWKYSTKFVRCAQKEIIDQKKIAITFLFFKIQRKPYHIKVKSLLQCVVFYILFERDIFSSLQRYYIELRTSFQQKQV